MYSTLSTKAGLIHVCNCSIAQTQNYTQSTAANYASTQVAGTFGRLLAGLIVSKQET